MKPSAGPLQWLGSVQQFCLHGEQDKDVSGEGSKPRVRTRKSIFYASSQGSFATLLLGTGPAGEHALLVRISLSDNEM